MICSLYPEAAKELEDAFTFLVDANYLGRLTNEKDFPD